jgi:uncharacterized protein YjiK
MNKYIIRIFSATLVMILSFPLMVVSQAEASKGFQFPYNLDNPDEKHILPGVLMEISGNVLLNDNLMICIQDEKAILFFYDLTAYRIIKQVKFGKDGDYEDVALVNDEVWVLRSNGTIYKLTNFGNEDKIKTREIKTRLSKKNNCEGLCYDPVENRLLIALKGKPEVTDEQDFSGFKAVYAFDPEKEKVSKKPEYLIELQKVKDMENASLYERISHRIAETFEESGDIRFQPSAIACHPITDEIYVLASVGKAIVVMNRKGELLSIQQLNKLRFPQPEGITFAADGTMYISSEGSGGSGTLMKFLMKE